MANRKNKYTTTRKSNELSDWQRLGLFALGIVCFIYILRQHTLTVITPVYIIYFFICIGLLGSILSYKSVPSNSNSFKILLRNFVLRTIVFGVFLTPLFLLTNTYLPNEAPYLVTTSIKEKHERASYKSSPYLVIELQGVEKNIFIHDYSFEELATKNSITLKLRKGFWGFLIIDYESIQIK